MVLTYSQIMMLMVFNRKGCPSFRGSRNCKGQTALETAFVFTMLIFLTLAFVNLAILLHTKNVATYAAFMAGRSFQVLGDQTGAEKIEEYSSQAFGGSPKFLSDIPAKTVAAHRAAEDIFTCALPWMSVPSGDELVKLTDNPYQAKPFQQRCLEGKRKYEKTNIGKGLNFAPFKEAFDNGQTKESLNEVLKSLREQVTPPVKFGERKAKVRDPLRFGIMVLKYRTPILFNPGNILQISGEDAMVRDEVAVPVLLNPGLSATLKKKDDKDKEFDDEKN